MQKYKKISFFSSLTTYDCTACDSSLVTLKTCYLKVKNTSFIRTAKFSILAYESSNL